MNILSLLNSVDDEQYSSPSYVAEQDYDPEVDAYMILRLLSCPSCQCLFNDPVTLPCGNTFCSRCLSTTSNKRLECPVIGCNRLHGIDIRSDVTVCKLTDICRRELSDLIPHVSQPRKQVQYRLNNLYDIVDDDDFSSRENNGFSIVESNVIEDYASDDYNSNDDCMSEYLDDDDDDGSLDLSHLKELLLKELECQVCSQLLMDPITTPCGHTYCKSCLTRSLDHSDKCPLCRYQLHNYNSILNQPINKTINIFISQLYPVLLADRRQSARNELYDDTQDTPLFVNSLVFPKMPCFLHIFEPKYRLMLRRCLESRQKQFGMVLKRDNGYVEYGTMLEIRSTEILNDGRSLVETIGTFRFKVVERGMRDGYDVGKIERIDDISPAEELIRERNAVRAAEINNRDPSKPIMYEPTISELISKARDFIESLRNGYAPWLLQRLNSTYGDMPSDPSDFSFWVASVIPIDENEKYRLLAERSVRERMKMIVNWIDQLKEQWWFDRGCVIS
ncbi:PUA-like domain-containing protein [Gigaspora margarita]|uniref:PUA-like domain-containing protein n=1 Tax=Gigaspora margarita TaxID=4874 RepID=A0A8H3X4C6_GIGMA|nr:PUA-like domain-containing protein [Gigaspora margarita]